MDIAQSAIMPDMVDEEDLEIWAYLKSKKNLIIQEGGFGRIELKFLEGRLGTKGYSVTHKARKKIKPNYRRNDMQYAAPSVNYEE